MIHSSINKIKRSMAYTFLYCISSIRNVILVLVFILITFLRIKREKVDVIVSLTSYGRRVRSTVFFSVCSLLLQSVRPHKIILWLDNDNWSKSSIPLQLKLMQRLGIEIEFCEDIKSFKKLIPSLKKYPNSAIVIADDDLLYSYNWLYDIWSSYLKSPNSIHCHRARCIRRNDNGSFSPYMDWPLCNSPIIASDIFPTFGAGALFPPHTLPLLTTQSDIFMKLCPHADDIWFWAMANLAKAKFTLVGKQPHRIKTVWPQNPSIGLFAQNGYNGQNDIQLINVMNFLTQNADIEHE